MGEVCYEPLIRDMVWSYSRVKKFDDCKYQWFLKYIRGSKSTKLFFSDFGTLVHNLLAEYYRGEKTPRQLQAEYLLQYPRAPNLAPSRKVYETFFREGLACFQRLPEKPEKVLSVEEKLRENINGIPVLGYIDLLKINANGGLVVVDHKSHKLNPRRPDEKYRKQDRELDDYLRQLYIYSALIRARYGRYPEQLCLNCYRSGKMIEEPFRKDIFYDTLLWFQERIDQIATESVFNASPDFFKCRYLCDVHDDCEYYP